MPTAASAPVDSIADGGLLPAPDSDLPKAPAADAVPAPPLPPASAPRLVAAPEPVVTIEGTVREKGARDPLPNVRITFMPLPPTSPADATEAVSDGEGRFRLLDLGPGVYLVKMRGPLIRPSETKETVSAGRRKTVTYYVPRREGQFETVVRAETVRKEVSEQTISAAELKRIPGTQNDPIKAIQNLPGVARTPFGGGQLIVWGSAPGDTRVYADGVLIPTLFHFGGLRSTINAEFVSELTFKPGAYGADYGRGLGGMVDITTRAPKSDRLHGSVTLDLIDGSVTLEGPITKKLHVAVGARVSWISAFLPIFNRSNVQVSPVYWDYQLAARYQATTRDDLDLFIFGSTDNLTARVNNPDPATNVDLDTRTYFSRVLLRWTHRFSTDTSLMIMPSFGGDTQRLDTGDNGIGGLQLKIDTLTFGYNFRAELRHRATSWLQVMGGVDFEGARDSFDVLAPQTSGAGGAPISLLSSQEDQSVLNYARTAPYLITRFEFWGKKLTVSPQFRFDAIYFRSYDGSVSRSLLSPEPRLFISYQAIPRFLLVKFGVGVFSQMPTTQQLSAVFGNPQLLLEYGATYVAGLESEPTATLSLAAQFFYKDLRTLTVSDPVTRYSNGGLGRVIGGDFLIRQRLWRGLFGWIAYTVSRSERKDSPEDPWRLFAFDQTHILTAIVSYKLPWWNLEVGIRFRYVTGDPTTPIVGGLRNTVSQNWTSIEGPINSARLPDFQQLDLRIDKTFIFNRWKLGIFLDIQNLYNYSNTEFIIYGGRQLYQTGPISGIPFFPDIGVRADF